MGTTLYVGGNGPFNRLVISNGTQVISTFVVNTGIIGQNPRSVSNRALVTGAGSLWSSASTLNIGFFGAHNQLVVSNGARVHSTDNCHVAVDSSSTNNRVTVSGAGSLWSSACGSYLGLTGLGTRLSVRDGGAVRAAAGLVGTGSGGWMGVEVAGSGPSWTS